MIKTTLTVFTFVSAVTVAAAQERSLSSSTNGPGARAGNITSTGETVPNPGASQSAGTTPMDRGIQRDDNKIQSSICKGC